MSESNRGLLVVSPYTPLELEVEKWGFLATVDEHDARQQQDTERESLNWTPSVPEFKGVRPKMSRGTGDQQEPNQ